MKMRSYIYLSVIFFIVLTSCKKEKFYGEFPLSNELRFILPESDTLDYYRTDSVINLLAFDSSENFFYRDEYDKDGSVTYLADFEIYTQYHTSTAFNIYYYLYVNSSPELQSEFLDISIQDNSSEEIIELHIEMPLAAYQTETIQPNIEFADSAVVNEHTLYDVYYLEAEDEIYYMKEGKGLVAFDLGANSWVISE